MKTKYAIKMAGSAAALAKLLGLTDSAISQWGETVPELRVYKLRELKPDWPIFIKPQGKTSKGSA